MRRHSLEKDLDTLYESVEKEEIADEAFNLFLSADYSLAERKLSKNNLDKEGLGEETWFFFRLAYAMDPSVPIDELSDAVETIHKDYLGDSYFLDRDYFASPYYDLLMKLEDCKIGDVAFEKGCFEPYEPFQYKERDYLDDISASSLPILGSFKTKVLYPLIRKNNDIWMSLVPHEIESMKAPFSAFKGKVLIYGLGLGYALYSALSNEEVSQVKVVEIDENIIEVFEKAILPFLPSKEKLEIVKADAIDFAINHKEGEFDVCFADLWKTAEDGLPLYAKLKKNEGAAKANYYWIEQEMLIYFRRHLLRLYLGEYYKDPSYIEDLKTSKLYPFFKRYYQRHKGEELEIELQKELKKESLIAKILAILD